MNKILYLPLDERPCNYKFPNNLIKATKKYELIIPDYSIMGYKKRASDFTKIRKFLLDNVTDASSAVISLDQLLYGGIVPSRIHNLSLDELSFRLNVIKEMKALNPNLKIHAFILIMRCPAYSSSDEEPDYYEEVGHEIFEYGVNHHLGKAIEHTLLMKIAPYIADYEDRRCKNLKMILKVLDEYYSLLDTLVIPQDDSAVSGYTMMDKIKIFNVIKEKNLNVLIYPGADEVGLILLTRCINLHECGSKKIYLSYLYNESKSLIPAYENKPLELTIFHQIEASGNKISDSLDDADIVLVLNYDKKEERESSNKIDSTLDKVALEEQFGLIKKAKLLNKTVSLVDKFYVNGGNIEYLKKLFNAFPVDILDGYAGWNTSSNSLGTAIAIATLVSYFGKNELFESFIVERILDDGIYQSIVRKYLTDNVIGLYGCNYFNAKEQNGIIAQLIKDEIIKDAKNYFPFIFTKYQIKRISLPWKRMFEIDIEVEKCEK